MIFKFHVPELGPQMSRARERAIFSPYLRPYRTAGSAGSEDFFNLLFWNPNGDSEEEEK